MQLSAEHIIYEACKALEAAMNYRRVCAFNLLRDAGKYLRGERIDAGRYAGIFFMDEPVRHTCADFPDMQCPACAGISSAQQGWILLDGKKV